MFSLKPIGYNKSDLNVLSFLVELFKEELNWKTIKIDSKIKFDFDFDFFYTRDDNLTKSDFYLKLLRKNLGIYFNVEYSENSWFVFSLKKDVQNKIWKYINKEYNLENIWDNFMNQWIELLVWNTNMVTTAKEIINRVDSTLDIERLSDYYFSELINKISLDTELNVLLNWQINIYFDPNHNKWVLDVINRALNWFWTAEFIDIEGQTYIKFVLNSENIREFYDYKPESESVFWIIWRLFFSEEKS